MGKIGEVYKCNICSQVVEVIGEGAGQLVCCGEPMELQSEKAEDQGHEKHVPVIEKTENGMIVKVGSIPHPMENEHHIAMIEVIAGDGKIERKYLKPGDRPEAEFEVSGDIKAREYCTVHGLWKSG